MASWQDESPVREPKASSQAKDTTKEMSPPFVAVVGAAVAAETQMLSSGST